MEGEKKPHLPEYIKKHVYWDDVERSGIEEYDESYLASLRSELKSLEDESRAILLIPSRFSGKGSFWGYSDSEVMSEETETELFENFTAAMVHLARRIKDCKNVLGFSYPDLKNDWAVLSHYESDYKERFEAAFQKKHSHYVFL